MSEEILKQILNKLNTMDDEIKGINNKLITLEEGQKELKEDISGIKEDIKSLKADMDNKFEMVSGKLDSIDKTCIDGFTSTNIYFDDIENRLVKLEPEKV